MNPIIRSLYDRKSVRAYTGQEISEETVQAILSAAVQAPTAGNQQLYTVLRVTDPERRHRLSIFWKPDASRASPMRAICCWL